MLEVLDQRRDRPVDLPALPAGRPSAGRLPCPCRGCPSPSRRAGRSARRTRPAPRQQAVVGEASLAGFRAVDLERTTSGSPRDVHHLRHGGLHAVRELVLLDARDVSPGRRYPRARARSAGRSASRRPAPAARDPCPAGCWRTEPGRPRSGTARPGTPRAESRCPTGCCPPVGSAAAGDHHHEPRQVPVLTSRGPYVTHEPIDGLPGRGDAGVQEQLRRRVVELVGLHRCHERHACPTIAVKCGNSSLTQPACCALPLRTDTVNRATSGGP